MGIGVEAAANRLKISPTNNQNGVPIIPEPTYDWATSAIPVPKETGLDLRAFPGSMDKLLEDFSKDSIRNTMLNHEKIFKEQVCELHRLYKVQKILMGELSRQLRLHHPMTATTANDFSGAKKSIFWSSHSPPFRDTPDSITHPKDEGAFHADSSTKAETSSRGPLGIDTRDALRLQRGLNFELGGGKESPGRSFSTIEDRPKNLQPCESEETVTLELTLSIGSGSARQKARPRPCPDPELRPSLLNSLKNRQHSIHSGMQEEGGSSGHDANLASEGVQQPAWLFQNLSLNRR